MVKSFLVLRAMSGIPAFVQSSASISDVVPVTVKPSLDPTMIAADAAPYVGRYEYREKATPTTKEKVSTLIIVGDAMARPLVDEWDASGPYDTSSLFALGMQFASPVIAVNAVIKCCDTRAKY